MHVEAQGIKRKGPITTWHAFLSNKYKGEGLLQSRTASSAYQEVKAENGPIWQSLVELSELGQQAHSAGELSFGRKPLAGVDMASQEGVNDVNSVYAMVPYETEEAVLGAHTAQLALLRRTRRAETAEAQKEIEANVSELQGWIGEHFGDDVFSQIPCDVSQPAPRCTQISFNPWSCQAIALARKALEGLPHSMCSKLVEAWSCAHEIHTTAAAGPVGPSPSCETKCSRNGQYICSASDAKFVAMVGQWQSAAKPLLEKGGRFRDFYTQGALVMELKQHETSLWFAVPALNLTLFEGSVMRLEFLDDPLEQRLANVFQAVALQIITECPEVGCMSLYSAFRLLEPDLPCTVYWWKTPFS